MTVFRGDPLPLSDPERAHRRMNRGWAIVGLLLMLAFVIWAMA